MNKKVKGAMPTPERVSFHGYDPLHGEVLQGGFEHDNIQSGNLRGHNGKHANDSHILSTKHYDGITPGAGSGSGFLPGAGGRDGPGPIRGKPNR